MGGPGLQYIFPQGVAAPSSKSARVPPFGRAPAAHCGWDEPGTREEPRSGGEASGNEDVGLPV